MTYPIQPRPFFQAAPNWGKPAKHSLPQNFFEQDRHPLFIVAASRHHEESHQIHGPIESVLLDQGFPVEYELDVFNPPRTRTTLRRLQLWRCRLRRKISLRHPATSSLSNIFWRHSRFSSQTTRTTHSWVTTSFLSLTSKHGLCYTYGDLTSLRHSTMPLP